LGLATEIGATNNHVRDRDRSSLLKAEDAPLTAFKGKVRGQGAEHGPEGF
jgi:hypothetical protein